MLMARFIVSIFSVGLMVLGFGVSSGQDYPNKPVRIVTSQSGGSTDILARLIADGLTLNFGQRVIVDPRAGEVNSTVIVQKSNPDGYTVLIAGTVLWIGPLLRKMPYDPLRDLLPVSLMTSQPNVLYVHPSLPVKSVKELIAYAKARPGALNYAFGGVGGLNHLAAELFDHMAGIKMQGIPYSSASVRVVDMLSGRVHVEFGTPARMPLVKEGKLRALAVTTAQPSALVPGLPTVSASGLPGYETGVVMGMFAPAKTAESIVNRLNQEVTRVLNRTEVKQELLDAGTEAVGDSAQKFASTIKSDMAKWGKLIKDADIHVDE